MDLMAARLQMAMSLGFHIIFASIGMAMPFFMAVSHWKWLKHREVGYRQLTKVWSKGVAVFFATGAVSGTALSFELGLLWPGFMEHAGPIIGMPFSFEGIAFFLEAIALGLFLYGWDRIPERVHWWCGFFVGVMGLLSGGLVITANAWMNSPEGFRWVNGAAVDVNPIDAMFNAAAFSEVLHMLIASFEATGFAVVGLHAFLLLRAPDRKLADFHRKALTVSLPFAIVAALLQPLSGDIAAKSVAERQPEKFAAMEAHFQTERGASILIGGIPDTESRTVRFGIRIPKLLSFLAFSDFNAEVKGLEEFPRENWPPVLVTHFAFQIMVGLGSILAAVSVIILFLRLRKRAIFENRLLLAVLVCLTPAGFIALEAGWVVTEVGRQPWIIYKIMRTSEALSPVPGLAISFVCYALLYCALTFFVTLVMRRNVQRLPELIQDA